MTAPQFSIVTPVYNTPPKVLQDMLRSVKRQSFADWELCLVDDASTASHIERMLSKAAKHDSRIRWQRRTENGGIVAASNDALAMAQGELVVLLDHDDELHPDALQKVSDYIASQPETDYLYTDEDKIDESGTHMFPFYKPDWSPERFRTQMYTSHLSVLRRSLVEEVGGFNAEFEGSQDWDLILRVTEKARHVGHIPEVLYHWRISETSVAGGGLEAKPYAYEAGTRALQAHCHRVGFPARVDHDEEHSGVYHLTPELTEEPLVSIIIPSAGTKRTVRGEDIVLLTHCVASVISRSTYSNYELVCVVDTSIDPAVIDQLRTVAEDRLRLVWYDKPFNFSDKINTGAIASQGEQLLLLNDDMEIITPDWIERLVMYATFTGIGAVGAKLLYADRRLQHVGLILRESSPGHLFRGFPHDHGGFANCVRVAGNFLAVTGACMMTSREAFELVGGLSVKFPLSFNDVDYCLKLQTQGLRVAYDPDTVLYHFESSTRSPDVDDWELDLFRRRWKSRTWSDPHDNPNFDQHTIHMVPPVYLTSGRSL